MVKIKENGIKNNENIRIKCKRTERVKNQKKKKKDEREIIKKQRKKWTQ